MITETFDLSKPSKVTHTLSLIINNSYPNKKAYYTLLNNLNSKMFKCNVELKLINNNGLIQFINTSFLNKDTYTKLLNLNFIHEPPIPINREFFTKPHTIFIG